METDSERQQQRDASAKESAPSETGPRPLAINSMSLCERQAVQALQALQRQPHAAHYFQQLMLQQHINKTQLHNLATVQQVKACVTSGSSTAAGGRPVTVATTSTLSQSLLLSSGAGPRGQMFLRVNRSLRAPISSQLIFLPGGAPPTAVAQPPSREVPGTASSGSQTDAETVQNLAVRSTSGPKGVKMEEPERSDTATRSVVPSPNKMNQPPPSPIKIPTYPQPTHLKAHPLLLHGSRTLSAGTAVPTTAHALVLTSAATSQARAYPLATATFKPAAAVGAGGAQTLVVQPLQKSLLGTDKVAHGNGPVHIQPKTQQGRHQPLQLPSRNPPPIMPAPPPPLPSIRSGGALQTPHIPVQILGAQRSTLRSGQAGCSQEGPGVLTSPLTMVPSSGEGGVQGRVQCPSGVLAAASPSAPQAGEAQSGATAASASGAAAARPSLQSKALKRKLESNDDFVPAVQRPPPLRDDASTLANMVTGSATSSPPPLQSASRAVCKPGEKAPPPRAVVKPHILTHVIEGFVIQEGGRPFPVCGPIKDSAGDNLAGKQDPAPVTAVLKCDYCEKLAPASQCPGTKRFCSTLCAKRYELTFGRRPSWEHQRHSSNSADKNDVAERRARRKVLRRTGSEIAGRPLSVQRHAESGHFDSASSGPEDEAVSLSSALSLTSRHRRPPPSSSSSSPVPHTEGTPTAPSSPAHWSVDQVSQFICSLQGCEKLASLFLAQEIDGQALLLLNEEHLVSTMNIKLGPALRICAHIHSLRE
ncbi:polyhomeotic-like protein 1 [Syngnathus scovelli]|uniref:polyhomeotic-like protein 1 n=1 Tax=Syngnathus scovelli TaxID=161590 RepID=UPI00210FD990|nr:polyhomeotic-like protein 1 [Syngnathus scovelli]